MTDQDSLQLEGKRLSHSCVDSVGKSWLEDRKTDVLYLIRSSRELVIEKEEEGE